MVEEFFAEVNDKYYPQVVDGLEMLDSGRFEEAVETLSRPLHTIKGVTGFMSGFERGSTFTHKVEDFLKAMQAGSVPTSEDNLSLAGRAVNMVFQVLEQIRDLGAPEEQETGEVLDLLAQAASTGASGGAKAVCDCFATEERNGVTIIKSQCLRVHTPADRELLLNALAMRPDGETVLMDLEGVLTCGSSTWEDVASHAGRLHLSVCCLAPTCRDVFLSWGFDRLISEHPDRDHFFAALKATGEGA